ncbi:glycosyltransferase N-terminal domain-containing protein [Pedobacter sp. Du54]|uniref:3-deoxy-D-manno-octulosonic acid transferase n=1 Tax=Pedobacter anseongensis TaxID=3133439 RepID=UPI00309DC8A0
MKVLILIIYLRNEDKKLTFKMIWIYTIGVTLFTIVTKIASLFHQKAKLFNEGRKNVFNEIQIKINANDRPIWFHFASLGEFEQGRPVLECIKLKYPTEKIVITFFSPSGFEIRKNYAGADGIFYLPIDTLANAKRFIDLVNPQLAIFTKYEFWFNYFNELHAKHIPLYLISGIFRPNQAFFKWYGEFYRKMLACVTHFFVQNEESVLLLNGIGITEVSLSGDTRFDRVFENAASPKKITEVEAFCGDSPVFIAGSTWLADEKILISLTEKQRDWKFIIAPHEVDEGHIQEIERLFSNSTRFSVLSSKLTAHQIPNSKLQTLIIDNIGMLSSLYQYGTIGYIGGGFGVGIHNTLEAAAFGLPVIFGPKYDKFQEAKDLIAIGAAKSVATEAELITAFEHFTANEKAAANAKDYVEKKRGATEKIINMILPSLPKLQ